MTEPLGTETSYVERAVPDCMIEAAARTIANYIPMQTVGKAPAIAREALGAALDALGLVMPIEEAACHDGTCSYRAEIDSGYYVPAGDFEHRLAVLEAHARRRWSDYREGRQPS